MPATRIFIGAILSAFLVGARIVTSNTKLAPIYWRLVSRLVLRTGLFDSEYFSQQINETQLLGLTPVDKFLKLGAWNGVMPSVLFDCDFYYTQRRPGLFLKTLNPILHYSYIGRHLCISPSPYFDIKYYLNSNLDVAHSGIDPLLHFLRFGGREGRNPSRNFNTAAYLSKHPAILKDRINPLVHYITNGCVEDLCEGDERHGIIRAPTPDWKEWKLPAGKDLSSKPQVDIIVPVYRNKEVTLRCLYSVLTAHVKIGYELVVINDQSPEPELVEALEGLARAELITLLTNDVNQGYVYSANLGMELHPDRDVVQLNSDAEVFNDWLDRMHSAAYGAPRIATVTPLSNNATVCSYPHFNRDNNVPLELEYSELDLLAGKVNNKKTVDVPTGVGFCMYIRRACIAEIGLFDQARFGRGYGEENDFCQRAAQKKWTNIVATGVFVLHHGSASFQADRHALIEKAMKKLHNLYPNYHRDVSLFIRSDPLASHRARLDWARLEREVRDTNVLILSHDLGGGTEKFVQDQAAHLQKIGCGVFIARTFQKESVTIGFHRGGPMVNVEPVTLTKQGALQDLISALRISEIQVHHVISLSMAAIAELALLAETGGVALKYFVHDYLAICPRINLVDSSGQYCGEPTAAACDSCLRMDKSRYGNLSIKPWRAGFGRLLSSAELVLAPDADVANRLKRYFPLIRIAVRPHEPELVSALPQLKDRRGRQHSDAPVKIVVIGAISPIKGLHVLLACAQDAKARGLEISFTVLGYTSNDERALDLGINLTGRYSEDRAKDMLESLDADAVFLPSIWPETYSYTLSLALRAGLPVFAFDIGAIASRLRAAGRSEGLMPLELANDASAVNSFMMERCNSFRQQLTA